MSLNQLVLVYQQAENSSSLQQENTHPSAKLPDATVSLFYQLARDMQRSHLCIVSHAPTLSAMETQRVLPDGVVVQKTVTVEISNTLLLWTGIGSSLRVERKDIRAIAQRLALSSREAKQHSINPKHIDPMQEFGMFPGMVSPFLEPQRSTKVAAVVLQRWPEAWGKSAIHIAISLSLYESLLIPFASFRTFLHRYACEAYPTIPLFEIAQKDDIDLNKQGEGHE